MTRCETHHVCACKQEQLETAIHHVQQLTLAIFIKRGEDAARKRAEDWLESIGRDDLD